MAKPITPRPIAPTPTLTGEDARRFHEVLRANKGKKISKERYEEMMKNAALLQSILKTK